MLLSAIQHGDSGAVDELLPLIYNQLREMARAKLAQESAGQALQATALVHEAYIRLVDTPVAQKWHSRKYFFAVAEAMRRILIESARRKQALVPFAENFRTANVSNPRLARAGFARSGVSQQNRLVERHETTTGLYYWISYDFKLRKARGDLVRFPLGPKFDGNPHNRFAFDHDGGEAIFSLPNGMQAYLLVNAKGERLDDPAPADVVNDSRSIAGTPAIVNGISCMNCHRRGMIGNFRDEIRGAGAVGGQVLTKVEDLYPKSEVMDQLVKQAEDRFMKALEVVIGPFLKVGDDKQKSVGDFPEPIGKVAEMYLSDLDVRRAALELGIDKPELLQAKIGANRDLMKLGLGTFVQQRPGTIKRAKWETREGTSLFQDVCVELRLGIVPVSH